MMQRLLTAAFLVLCLTGTCAVGDEAQKAATALASSSGAVGKDFDNDGMETDKSADGDEAEGKDDGADEDKDTDVDAEGQEEEEGEDENDEEGVDEEEDDDDEDDDEDSENDQSEEASLLQTG